MTAGTTDPMQPNGADAPPGAAGGSEPTDDLPSLDEVRRVVERHFRVYDSRTERVHGQDTAHLLFLMMDSGDFDGARYEAMRTAVMALRPELLVFLRREGGEDILFVAPRPTVKPSRVRVNLVLLVLTLITTATAGAVYWQGYARVGEPWSWGVMVDPTNLLWGSLTFALPLMFILGVHESAHYITARKHGLRATLPFFIPVPPFIMPFGTFGAFISLKDPLPDRKVLFDVGASGPIAGFLVAVPILLVGVAMTDTVAMEVPDFDRPAILADGFRVEEPETGLTVLHLNDPSPGVHFFTLVSASDDWRYTLVTTIEFDNGTVRTDRLPGTLDEGAARMHTLEVPLQAGSAEVRVEWNDGLIRFGDPLLVTALKPFTSGEDYLTHPTFFAAWVGLLVTGINLLPAGQLDGGHVARAVLGDRVRWAATASLALLFFLAFQFSAWILMALFLILTGIHHPPPLNDRTPLDMRRKILAGVVLVVFIVSFVPVPIQF